MKLVRSIGAVVAGYLLIVIAVQLLFRLSGRNPHAPASPEFMIVTTVYGFLFAALGGYVAAGIAGRLPLMHAAVLACIVALIGVMSLLTSLGNESIWTQMVALLFMAPAVLLGGMLRIGKAERAGH